MNGLRPTLLLGPALGFGLWAIAFAAIYSVQGLGCELGWDEMPLGPISRLRAILIVLWFAALLASLLLARRLSGNGAARRGAEGPGSFVLAVSIRCAWFAVPAIAFTFAGALATTACA